MRHPHGLRAAAGAEFDFLDPANIGRAAAGGFFAGLISHTADGNPTHALIVAPAATGATGTGYVLTTRLEWKTTQTTTAGTTSSFDGAVNTAAMVAAGISDHPAAEFCVNLSINGYSDWYLPARFELDIAYENFKPTTQDNSTSFGINAYAVPERTVNRTTTVPGQTAITAFIEGGAEAFVAEDHWASDEQSATAGYKLDFRTGAQTGNNAKTNIKRLRAFRKVAL